MYLKLQKYDLEVCYTESKQLYVADTLSCAYLNVPSTDDDEDLEFVVHALVHDLQVFDAKLPEIQSPTQDDEQLQKLHQYIVTGLPSSINSNSLSLWNYRKLWKSAALCWKPQYVKQPCSHRAAQLVRFWPDHFLNF